MKRFILIVLFLISIFSKAQVTFKKLCGGTGNNFGNMVQQTNDGGYVISASTSASFDSSSGHMLLIKSDFNGNLLWTKTFGSTGTDEGYAVKQTSIGEYIICGYTTINYGAKRNEIYLIKTNSNGDTLWTKTYGGTNDDNAYDIQLTNDGGFIIAGETASFGAG